MCEIAPGCSPVSAEDTNFTTDADKTERHAFKQSISWRIEDYPDFLEFIFFSDKKNYHKENMHFCTKAQSHRVKKMTV